MGSCAYAALVIVISIQLLTSSYEINPFQVFFVLLSIALYFFNMEIFGEIVKSDNLRNVTEIFDGAPLTFFSLLCSASICIIVDMIVRR